VGERWFGVIFGYRIKQQRHSVETPTVWRR
jgi:hypothetical protein